jgi:hypothetical protein
MTNMPLKGVESAQQYSQQNKKLSSQKKCAIRRHGGKNSLKYYINSQDLLILVK